MNSKIYSNREFTELRKRINEEILRRGTYRWMDPLSTPKVGEDKTPPLSLPIEEGVPRVQVDDRTYTINTPSEGSIEPTKNIRRPIHGDNPGGGIPQFVDNIPNSSAGLFTADEMRNFIVGLTKIDDINLFYGRDEEAGISFRDANNIEDLLSKAEADPLNEIADCICRFYLEDGNLVMESYIDPDPDVVLTDDGYLQLTYNDGERSEVIGTFKFWVEDGYLKLEDAYNYITRRDDPNGGYTDDIHPDYPVQHHTIFYPHENGIYVMPSGESDGEEVLDYRGLGPHNFFDDYGASPGDGNYHPYNRATTPITRRNFEDQDNKRRTVVTVNIQGGIDSASYGQNPRNPNPGKPYKSRPVYRGSQNNSCQNMCTGLCLNTCDNTCSMSCTSTCFSRCGNACTSTCGAECTGCSTMCYMSCKTKCENAAGYACVKAGAKSVRMVTTGGNNGEPETKELVAEYHSCDACSYSCQFYPNKKTTCWDSGCMGKCFVSCLSSCSTACTGGCINNDAVEGDYKTGKGRGCESQCTINCIGICQGVCEGQCTQTCWHACKDMCADNCTFVCSTNCGSGCANGCKNGCTGCDTSCDGSCKGGADMMSCNGCSTRGGCSSTCQHDCNSNCIGKGCKSMCGIDSAGACEANCRINCTNASCTALCSNACSDACTTCVNSCGWQCGACSSQCSTSCSEACGLTCDGNCKQSCSENCVMSCTESCGGCSGLCYSCVAMCIGICSVKCQAGCSSCTNQCGWWCDTSCNEECFSNCNSSCMDTCNGTCATRVTSESTRTPGPTIPPTSSGYPIPNNRIKEQQSFRLVDGSKIALDICRFFIDSEDLIMEAYITDEPTISINEQGELIVTCTEPTDQWNKLSKYHFEIDEETLDLMLTQEEDE